MLITTQFPAFADRVDQVPVSFIREILKAANQSDVISFAGGLPNPSLFPMEQLAKAAQEVLSSKLAHEALQYSVTEGYYPLRNYLSNRYRRCYRMEIPPENILITNGSQQALDLLGKAYLNPGDPVLLEKPSYLGAIQCFSMFQASFHEVGLEEDGIDLEAFKEACWEQPPKLFYCIPNFQNPTGIQYSVKKRMEVAKYIRNYASLVIEDDPYGEICFDGAPLDPIKSYNPSQVVLLGSFSKIVSPGMRLGWLAADTAIIEKLTRIKQATDLQSNQLAQRILYRYLETNDLDAHIKTICNRYGENKTYMVKLLQDYLPSGVTFVDPKGGMFVWLKLPHHVKSEEVLVEAMKSNVIFVPGHNFYASNGERNTLRLNFSNASRFEMEEGIKRLCMVLKAFC